MLLRVRQRETSAAMTRLPTRTLAVLAVMIGISVVYIDRPLTLLCTHLQAARLLFQLCAAPSLLSLPLAGIVCVVAIARRFSGQAPLPHLWLMMSVATIAGTAAKDELKWLFGRPWPGSWVKYGVYGFHPFTDSILYGGFPSGHTSYIAAPMCLLCWLAPRYRAFWVAVVAVVMVGLVGAGYHFVGDVVAGFFVGLAAAAAVVSLQRHVNGQPSGPRGG
jgi:membrane-associated phospholipid phosphatase